MISAGHHASSPTATPTKESGAYIFACAREAGLEPISLSASITAVLTSFALVSRPEDRLASSRHARNVLGMVRCPRENEEECRISPGGFAAPDALR